MIQEEIEKIISEEEEEALDVYAKNIVEQQASTALESLKVTSEKTGMDVEKIKSMYIEFLQNMS